MNWPSIGYLVWQWWYLAWQWWYWAWQWCTRCASTQYPVHQYPHYPAPTTRTPPPVLHRMVIAWPGTPRPVHQASFGNKAMPGDHCWDTTVVTLIGTLEKLLTETLCFATTGSHKLVNILDLEVFRSQRVIYLRFIGFPGFIESAL